MPRKVVAKVISQKGDCALDHKVGDTVVFTKDEVQGRLCLSAHYSMLPKVYAMHYDAKFPWLKEGQKSLHACPDALNPVVFELETVDE